MRLALFEPDIPQNVGTIMRLCACLDVPLDVIEPCGFVFADKQLRRAGMDYMETANVTRHDSWRAFRESRGGPDGPDGRLVLLTTVADSLYTGFRFRDDDILLMGRESAGVPDAVHAAADARLRIPLRAGARSLNVAVAAAMALGEALRQTNGFPIIKSQERTDA